MMYCNRVRETTEPRRTRHDLPLRAAVILASCVLGCGPDRAVDSTDAGSPGVAEFAPGQGSVHGYIDANVGTAAPAAFGLPDAAVQLRRVSDGLLTASVTTDVHGGFIASKVPAGTYTICLAAAAGFSPSCSQTSFVVTTGKIAYPAHAVFSPLRFVVFGRVRLADGSDVRYENDEFGTEVNVRVRALLPDGTLVAGPVRANGRGEYVLGQVPAKAGLRIIAQSEAVSAQATISSDAAATRVDLVLANRRPVVDEINALQGGVGVRHVAAGSTVRVEVRASDPDGQALHYRWLAPGGSCAAVDAPATDCTMPGALGTQSIYVQISDGVGQYAVGRVRVAIGEAISLFSGKVVTDGGAAVPGAEIRLNGKITSSDARGGFALQISEGNRYVLTIKKDGFQLISKVFQTEQVGATYQLLRASTVVIDPTVDNTIVLRVPKSRSTGGQEGGYKDASVVLKARSIVDAAGNVVTTPVTTYGSRFDHLFDPYGRMPGDSGAVESSGRDVSLVSFGAIELNLRGAAGEKYNLAPNMPADVTYPVHSSQLASAPATIPLWYYNETTGLWEEDGTATLVSGSYLAKAKHFSAINVDLKKSNATCLKIVVDQTTLTVPFKIRLSIPGSPVVERTVTDNVSAIVRLPPNVASSTIVVLDSTNTPIPLSQRTFSTGDVLPDGTNLSLPAPYNVCITPPSPPVTLTIDLPQNPNPFWLTRKINPGASDVQRSAYADAYYTAIAADATLDAWKTRNGFTPGDDASAFYFNAGDLEFGRSMHMKHRSDGGIAYYVTNFADADKAFGGLAADVIATVAMEYSKFPQVAAGAPKFTKFYVFDKAGNRVNKAELDNRGDKYVPGLCVVCHGGTLPPDIATASPPGNTDSRFIPFDLKSFDSSPLAPGFPALLQRPAQEENFRKLNEGVYLNTSATDAQKALIEAWYDPNVSNVGQVQQDGIANIPFNWTASSGIATATDSQFYYDVVRPSCRSCHASRGPGLDFGDPAAFMGSGASFAVCTGGYMPQSFVTWRNFWHSQSPHQPTRMEQYFGLAAGSCTGP